MGQRFFLFLLCLTIIAGASLAMAAEDSLPMEHWAYSAMAQVQAAGLAPGYPSEWIASGNTLTRGEFAFYIRDAIMVISRNVEEGSVQDLPLPLANVLGELVAEFAPELDELGVDIRRWPEGAFQADYVDLDTLLPALSQRPEVPPANPPPDAEAAASVTVSGPEAGTGSELQMSPESLPYRNFLLSNNLGNMTGSLFGIEWSLGLSGSSQPITPLHLGSYMISNVNSGLEGDLDLNFGNQVGLNFDALCFLDLDQAQEALDIMFHFNTEFDLSRNIGLYGGLSLSLQPDKVLPGAFTAQFSTGLRYLLTGDLYIIAEYSLANPFDTDAPHLMNTSVGLSLGDIGLLLLGIQATSFSDFEGLQLTGEFIYRF